MFRLIASDLDGTIFNNEHYIPKDNIKAVELLQKNDIPLVICTGKTYSISKDICKTLNANFGIFGNGNHIINLTTGKEIFKKTLTLNEIRSCISTIQKYNLHIHAYTEDSIITTKPLYLDLRSYILFPNKIKFELVESILDYIEKHNTTILKLIISSHIDLSQIKEDLEKSTKLNIMHIKKKGQYKDKIINKEYEYLDISPLNVTKGEALKQLKKYLDLEKDDILSIGDNINDITMFNVSGTGVAVNNAYEEVKRMANFTTTNSAENGAFAEAIYKFIQT